MSQRESRKLAAILAADIAGYCALMGADEDATVRLHTSTVRGYHRVPIRT